MAKVSAAKLAERIEIMLNDISCEQRALTIVVQVLLRNLIGTSPDQTKAFATVQRQVLGSIDAMEPAPDDAHGSAKRLQMTRTRAEAVLEEIGQSLGLIAPSRPPSNLN